MPFFYSHQNVNPMAVVQLAPLVSEIRGKVGGVVFQTSRYGQIVKINNFRGSNRTGDRGIVGTDIAKGSNSWWGLLSAGQQAAWASASIDFPTTDRYGNPVVSTGYNFYQRTRLLFPDSAGYDYTTPPVLVVDGTDYDVDAFASGANMRVTYERIAGTRDGYMIIDATPGAARGVNSPPNRWRRIVQASIGGGPTTATITSNYTSVWQLPLPGTNTFVRVRVYAQKSPQLYADRTFLLRFA